MNINICYYFFRFYNIFYLIMSLPAQNFRAVGIKGQGSIFNVIDTTPETGGLALTVLTGIKTITVGTGWTLNVGILDITEPGSIVVGPISINYDGSIFYNTSPYIHVTTLPSGTPPSNLGVGIDSLASVAVGAERNTGVGNLALNAVSTGTYNTTLGYRSGFTVTTGTNNTLLGADSGNGLPPTQNHCVLLNNDGSSVSSDGEVHLGNETDQSLVFAHCPLVTDRSTSSTGPAAIPPTSCYHEITTTGADALTLADGTPGQHIVIVMVVDGGNATLTPDTFASAPEALIFTEVGHACHLMFSATVGWVYLGGLAEPGIP